MKWRFSRTVLAAASLAGWLLAAEPSPQQRASEAVTAFMKAVQFKNLDDLLAVVAVPWFHDGKVIIHDLADLRREFDHLFQKRLSTENTLRFTIRKTVPYRELRDQIDPDDRKLAEQVLTPQDWLSLVDILHSETGQRESVVVFVRWRDGQAKIVGLKN